MVKVNIEDGYYLFKLNDILRNRNISKNKLMRETNTDFKVIQRIINGELTKLDIIVLLVRLGAPYSFIRVIKNLRPFWKK